MTIINEASLFQLRQLLDWGSDQNPVVLVVAVNETASTGKESKLSRSNQCEPGLLVVSFLHDNFLIDSVFQSLAILICDFKSGANLLCREYIQSIPTSRIVNVPCYDGSSDIGTKWHMAL